VDGATLQQCGRLNVIPHSRPEDGKANEEIKYSHKDEVAAIPDAAIKALTTSISLTGTAEARYPPRISGKMEGIFVI
jgi:hypothetical protein